MNEAFFARILREPFVFKVYHRFGVGDARVTQRDQLVVSIYLAFVSFDQVFQNWASLLVFDGFFLGSYTLFQKVVIWKVLVLQFCESNNIAVLDESFSFALLKVLHFPRLAQVLLVLHDVHDVLDYGLVACRKLLANLFLNLILLFLSLLD